MFLSTDPHTSASQIFFDSQLAAYNGYLAEIMSSANVELSSAKVADALGKVSALVGDIARNAPVGSENAMAMLLSSVTSAHLSHEQARQAARQAAAQVAVEIAPATPHRVHRSKRNLLG